MDVLHDRRRQRQHLARQRVHLLRDLEPGHAVADQRLVDVEVEEPHLGVGDLGHRLPVDAHELQEGDEREARGEHRGDVLEQRAGPRAGPRRPSAAPGSRRRRAPGAAAPARARRLARPPRAAPCRRRLRTGPRGSRRPAGRPRWPRGSRRSVCPRSRRRATSRAWATAGGVQRPSSSGTRPRSTQRLSVVVCTPASRAASASDTSPLFGSLTIGLQKGKRRDRLTIPPCAGLPARCDGRGARRHGGGALRTVTRPLLGLR